MNSSPEMTGKPGFFTVGPEVSDFVIGLRATQGCDRAVNATTSRVDNADRKRPPKLDRATRRPNLVLLSFTSRI